MVMTTAEVKQNCDCHPEVGTPLLMCWAEIPTIEHFPMWRTQAMWR